MSNSN
jgi:hypothetical protein